MQTPLNTPLNICEKVMNFLKIQFIKNIQKITGNNYNILFAMFRILMFYIDSKELPFKLFLSLMKKDSNVIDIGANTGVMSFFLAKKVKKGKIFAFEPLNQNFYSLFTICQLFNLKNLNIYKIALGNENKRIKIILPVEKGVFLYGLTHIVNSKLKWYNEGKKYYVEMKRLDDIDFLEGVKINFIKIDVENFELEVLKGAKKIIGRYKPIILCELWENEFREKIFEFLSNFEYRIFCTENKKLVRFKNQKVQDFFFIP